MSLRVIEGEKMRKGKFVEGIFLLAACVLLCLGIFVYLKKDDSEAKRYADKADEAKLAVDALDGKITGYQDTVVQLIDKLKAENKAVTDANMALFNDLNHRVGRIETTSDTPKNLNLSFAEPLKVSVVYREAKMKPKPLIPGVLPDAPFSKPSVNPHPSLLERAGVTNQ
jgi:hypothetical protein